MNPLSMIGMVGGTRQLELAPSHSLFLIPHFTFRISHSSSGEIGLLTSGVNSITGISSVRPSPVLSATAT